jgi:hypothetical protein
MRSPCLKPMIDGKSRSDIDDYFCGEWKSNSSWDCVSPVRILIFNESSFAEEFPIVINL